jgi:hypothetical protein
VSSGKIADEWEDIQEEGVAGLLRHRLEALPQRHTTKIFQLVQPVDNKGPDDGV